MQEKCRRGAIMKVFLLLMMGIILVGCNGGSSGEFGLEKKTYTDVLFIHDETRVVDLDGLKYLEVKGKNVQGPFFMIQSVAMMFSFTHQHPFATYYLAYNEEMELSILTKSGEQIGLPEDTRSVETVLADYILLKMDDDTYQFVNYQGEAQFETYEDVFIFQTPESVVDTIVIAKYTVEEEIYYDIIAGGKGIVASDVESYETIQFSGKSMLVASQEELYTVMDFDGNVLLEDVRAYNRTGQLVRFDQQEGENEEATIISTYMNQDGESFAVERNITENEFDIVGQSIDMLVIWLPDSTYAIGYFGGEVKHYESVIVSDSYSTRPYYITESTTSRELLNYKGEVLYQESVSKEPAFLVRNYRYNSSKDVQMFLIDEGNDTFTLINHLGSTVVTIQSNYTIQGLAADGYLEIVNPLEQFQKTYILYQETPVDIDEVTFWLDRDVVISNLANMDALMYRDPEDMDVMLLDLREYSTSHILSYEDNNFAIFNTAFLEIIVEEEAEPLRLLRMDLYYYLEETNQSRYLYVYRNINGVLKYHLMQEALSVESYRNVFYTQNQDINAVYRFDENYEFTKAFDTHFNISGIRNDEDLLFFEAEHSASYGRLLLDANGNVLVNPMFDRYEEISDGYIVVRKHSLYGLIHVEDGEVKIIEDVIHERITYLYDGMYIIENALDEFTVFTAPNKKVDISPITQIGMVPHYITNEETGEYDLYLTLKIVSGTQVRLLKLDLKPDAIFR